jgi:Lysyl oxidase
MTRAGLRLRTAAMALAGLAAASVTAPGLPGAAASTPAGPQIKLIPAQNSITVSRFGHRVDMDPGIWTASLGSALEFDIQRPDYTSPLSLTQVIHLPGGGVQQVPFPATLIGRVPSQLRQFIRVTVATTKGKVLDSSKVGFCPDSYDPQRAVADSPATSPYPQECVADPFPKSLVWGVAKGWAVDPLEERTPSYRLALGSYRVTETILPPYTTLLHIAPADATATVKVKVVKSSGCCGPAGARARPAVPASRALPSLPRARTLADPPASARPDLVPLPSWGISVQHIRGTKKHPASDQVDFGATVSISGNGPLDVEGFRSHGSPTMKAYQYFWQDGKVIGRVRAGTMGFDTKKGHNHWHFQQFARYSLLNSAHQLAVPSRKVGFCIAPTDPVDLLVPGAVWQPSFLGFGGQCGSPTALWVQEELPLGWGDTYFQSVAGQSFDITHLPNGTYYIEIQANPEHVLYETDTSNDVSLRKVILGGRPGHRTVRVPALNGIDPEG